MNIYFEIDINKDKMNKDGKSINEFDFEGLAKAIKDFDKDYIRKVSLKFKDI